MADYNAARIFCITRSFDSTTPFTATEAYEHAVAMYGIDDGYFIGSPNDYYHPQSWPSILVIDLGSGRVLQMGGRRESQVVRALKFAHEN